MPHDNPSDLAELRAAFVAFREAAIKEIAELRLEIAAVHRAAVENSGEKFNERYLVNARSHLLATKPSIVDEIRGKFRAPQS